MSQNKKFVDESWALWIDGNDITTIYFNEWINPKKKSYVDVAIHVRNILKSNQMNLYIPFVINEEEIFDISLKLENEKILRATFSATCLIDYKKNEFTSEIAYNGKTIDLVHLSKEFIKLKYMANGTIFTYDLSKLHQYLDNNECYFIFRIPHKSLNKLFKVKRNIKLILGRIRDAFTTPVISNKYWYSIRINEGRLIPEEINKIGSFHRQKLEKAVVSVSIDEEYEINDTNCEKIRRVEKDLYESYVPEKFNCDDSITYIWIKERKDDHKASYGFNINVSNEYISRTSLLVYIFLIMIVGILGETLWDFIKFLLELSEKL